MKLADNLFLKLLVPLLFILGIGEIHGMETIRNHSTKVIGVIAAVSMAGWYATSQRNSYLEDKAKKLEVEKNKLKKLARHFEKKIEGLVDQFDEIMDNDKKSKKKLHEVNLIMDELSKLLSETKKRRKKLGKEQCKIQQTVKQSQGFSIFEKLNWLSRGLFLIWSGRITYEGPGRKEG